MSHAINHVLILGCGYVGQHVAVRLLEQGVQVTATTRSEMRASELAAKGIHALSVASVGAIPQAVLQACDAVLDSIPLMRSGDTALAPQCAWLPVLTPLLKHIRWAGYLSATSVYGDAGGAWVGETHICAPTSARGQARLEGEQCWLSSGLPAEVFRIAGIYGPGRNILPRLMAGGYQAVRWRPEHYSSRIHVADIVEAVLASMCRPRAGRIVNLADDCPLSHADYVCELAAMIGAPKPLILTPEEGEQRLSSAALDFFRDNKRISNHLLHQELLPELQYPSFREAVPELLAEYRSGM